MSYEPTSSPIFSAEEERLTIHSLSGSDGVVQKVLQELESKLRSGRIPADSGRLRASTIACLSRENLAIKRWAVNVLVELGIDGSFDELDNLVPHCANDPDLLASVVRLLFSGMREVVAIEFMKRADFSVEGLVLIAGSEFSRKLKRRLLDEKIPLDGANADQLRAGIVLTGRGHAPENLFLRGHPNVVALSELNLHDNAGVVKYALWCMAELEVSPNKLKIPVEDIDDCEEQIRKWVYRLIFTSLDGLSANLDLISHVARDESQKVREEAAIGLKRNFVSDSVARIIKWFSSESGITVKNALIDHFAFNIEKDARYSDLLERLYKEDQFRGTTRERIEAGVQGTEFYARVRQIELREEVTSFLPPFEPKGMFGMPKIEQNFTNSVIGGVTGSGHVDVGGQTVSSPTGVSATDLSALVAQLLAHAELITDAKLAGQGRALAKELEAKPSRSMIETAIGWVRTAASGATAGSALIQASDGLIEDLSNLAGQM